jgi:hypothetical protein
MPTADSRVSRRLLHIHMNEHAVRHLPLTAMARHCVSVRLSIYPPEEAATQQKLAANKISQNSMLRTSIVPTIIKGGFSENVIPADKEALWTCVRYGTVIVQGTGGTLDSFSRIVHPAELCRQVQGQLGTVGPR